MAKQDLDPNYLDPDYEPVVNHSGNTPFTSVLASRLKRRTVMKGTVGAALTSLMGAAAIDGDPPRPRARRRAGGEVVLGAPRPAGGR